MTSLRETEVKALRLVEVQIMVAEATISFNLKKKERIDLILGNWKPKVKITHCVLMDMARKRGIKNYSFLTKGEFWESFSLRNTDHRLRSKPYTFTINSSDVDSKWVTSAVRRWTSHLERDLLNGKETCWCTQRQVGWRKEFNILSNTCRLEGDLTSQRMWDTSTPLVS